MICNNCGAEIEEGMKFCGECGEAVPQVKICVSCGAEIAIRMKFCPECGTNQNTGAKAGKTSTIKTGMSLGDKNVIGGSVIGKKEETVISGNATIVKTEDQTKLVKQCHICGSNVSILNGFDCPECGQFTCQNCYDEEEGCCVECAEDKKEQKFDRYKEAVNQYLADGRIDQTDRKKLNSLQKELGLSSEKAKQLEEEIKNNLNKNELTTFEKMNIKRATELFYNDIKTAEALNLLKPVYQSHKTEEEVLNIYLPVLAEASPEEAMNVIKGLQIDILSAFVTLIGIYITQGNLIEAEKKLKQALRIWKENTQLKCYSVFYNCALHKQFNDDSFLEQAENIFKQLGEAKNQLELSYQLKAQEVLQKTTGESVTEYSKEYCKQNGLYYYVMSKNPLLSKEENEKERRERERKEQERIQEEERKKREAEEKEQRKQYLEILQKQILENEREYSLEQLKEVEEEYHNSVVQYYIASRYLEKKDYANSLKWAQKSAEQGLGSAQCILGKFYDKGKDYTEAAKWYRLAAEQGDVFAQYNLGYMYDNGQGVPQDYEQALKWYTKAAEQGDMDAQYNLGNLYYNGQGVTQDYIEAEKWFRKAAKQGDGDSQYILGLMYNNGQGVIQDEKEALEWFRRAAEKGNQEGQYILGYMFYSGNGLSQNYQKAIIWYEKAAEQGNEEAQLALGNIYYTGTGVKQDYQKARKWYEKAAEQGNTDAQNTLDFMNEEEKNTKDKDIEQAVQETKDRVIIEKTESKELEKDFVFVDGGTFNMGSFNGNIDERPVHKVTLNSFYMCNHEVTQEEWETVMGNNPSYFKGESRPVETVSWIDVINYCNNRSLLEGRNPCYSFDNEIYVCDFTANGYRLPTEAEWEYAAKGGQKSQDKSLTKNNNLNNFAWYNNNSEGFTHKVMQKQSNELGLYDMSGNVYEWCWDWYDNYDYKDQENPTGANTGKSRVVRGGSWNYSEEYCYTNIRDYETPNLKYNYIGFRVVCSNDYKSKKTVENKKSTNDFAFVKGGTFQMGNPDGESNERPMHSVTLDSFYICTHQVTQSEWKRIIGNNPSIILGDSKPVEKVSWYDAIEYCNKRSLAEGFTPCYKKINGNYTCDFSADGYRLPTEAEWEYAAIGGIKSNEYIYSGSSFIEGVAWYSSNSNGSTHDIMTKRPNELGLYDMSGNVYEWCWDWYVMYDTDDEINPKGTNLGSYKVYRGGSCYNNNNSCTVTARNYGIPDKGMQFIGFRVVRSKID